jgi:hypothetical protein
MFGPQMSATSTGQLDSRVIFNVDGTSCSPLFFLKE